MGGWLWRRRVVAVPVAADGLVGMLGAGAAPAVLGLARRVEWPVRAARALRLVAVAGLSDEEAAAIGALGLHRRLHRGAGRAERFVRAVVALDRQRRRNHADPRFWTEAERFGLFDPQGLTLTCAHDRVLALLADRVRAEALAVLRRAGDDPALLALRAWGVRRPAPTIHCG